jgi:hypothetical protein
LGVSLPFGIYYHLHPAVDRSRLASLQVWVWMVGTIVLTIGVALVHSGRAIGDPIAAVSSLLVLADTLLFGWLSAASRQACHSLPCRVSRFYRSGRTVGMTFWWPCVRR